MRVSFRSSARTDYLFGAEGDGGVDAGGAPGRRPAGNGGNSSEQSDDAEVGHPVKIGDTVEQGDQGVAGEDGCAGTDDDAERGEAHTVAQNQGQDVAAGRAEGSANADFAGALGDAAREHSIHADGGESQRSEAEGFEEDQDEIALRFGNGDEGVHGGDADPRATRS